MRIQIIQKTQSDTSDQIANSIWIVHAQWMQPSCTRAKGLPFLKFHSAHCEGGVHRHFSYKGSQVWRYVPLFNFCAGLSHRERERHRQSRLTAVQFHLSNARDYGMMIHALIVGRFAWKMRSVSLGCSARSCSSCRRVAGCRSRAPPCCRFVAQSCRFDFPVFHAVAEAVAAVAAAASKGHLQPVPSYVVPLVYLPLSLFAFSSCPLYLVTFMSR